MEPVDKEFAEHQAKEIAKNIVNAIANQDYDLIKDMVDDLNGWSTKQIAEIIEEFKNINDLGLFDKYDAECSFVCSDGSRYEKEEFYHHNNGFGYEYAFTSDGNINDLTLMLDFVYKDDQIKVIFDGLDVH